MRLVIDTREQTPLNFQNSEAVQGTLQTGDYSVQGLEHLLGDGRAPQGSNLRHARELECSSGD